MQTLTHLGFPLGSHLNNSLAKTGLTGQALLGLFSASLKLKISPTSTLPPLALMLENGMQSLEKPMPGFASMCGQIFTPPLPIIQYTLLSNKNGIASGPFMVEKLAALSFLT